MENFAVTLLLLIALVLPVVLFLLLRLRTRLSSLSAAAIAVAAGWAFNIAYFYFAQKPTISDPSQANGDNLAIAISFGWVCPTMLVLVTWLVWHLATRRKNPDNAPKPPPENGVI